MQNTKHNFIQMNQIQKSEKSVTCHLIPKHFS